MNAAANPVAHPDLDAQPWDHLRAWRRELRKIPKDWATCPLAYLRRRVIRVDDDSRHMAWKEIDWGATARGFTFPSFGDADLAAAEAIFADALSRARPRAVPFDKRNSLSQAELEVAASKAGIPIEFKPEYDKKQARGEGPEHRIHCDRAVGILQSIGRVYRGHVGVSGIHALADIAALTPAGKIIVVEAMNSHDLWNPDDTFVGKCRMAERFAEHGALFAFTGDQQVVPPWVNVSKETTRRLRVPGGTHRVRDGWDVSAQPNAKAPDAGIHHMPDPEEVDSRGRLLIERLLAR